MAGGSASFRGWKAARCFDLRLERLDFVEQRSPLAVPAFLPDVEVAGEDIERRLRKVGIVVRCGLKQHDVIPAQPENRPDLALGGQGSRAARSGEGCLEPAQRWAVRVQAGAQAADRHRF